jgi:hypothetical protein
VLMKHSAPGPVDQQRPTSTSSLRSAVASALSFSAHLATVPLSCNLQYLSPNALLAAQLPSAGQCWAQQPQQRPGVHQGG